MVGWLLFKQVSKIDFCRGLANLTSASLDYYISLLWLNETVMASLRRSGVRLSSLGKSNGDLKMVIMQLKTVRENYVGYSKAQEKAMDDMTKWAFKEENRAIQVRVIPKCIQSCFGP